MLCIVPRMRPLWTLVAIFLVVSTDSFAPPDNWVRRAAQGQLVWSTTPINGPMPNFGNGYIAAQYNSTSMFIAGVFSGASPPPFGAERSDNITQRADIPLLLASTTGWTSQAIANDMERAWVENFYDREDTTATAILRHYAHRDRMHLLLTEVTVNNTAGKDTVRLDAVIQWPASPPHAVVWRQSAVVSDGPNCHVGQTVATETGAAPITIAICHTATGSAISAKPGEVATARLMTSIWTSQEATSPLHAAIQDWAAAEAVSMPRLRESHLQAQETLWGSRIEIEDNLPLALAVNSSLYGILISVRDDLNYSTSPGGLPNGCYKGHVFWDMEQFIWPNLLLLHPKMARAALQYRFERMESARQNSIALTDTAGLKFPWESAVTGLASTTFVARQNEVREIHIDGDVSLAMWQYYQASRDVEWLRGTGWPVMRGVAQFWASRLSAAGQNVSLINAGGPDETNSNATDNTYDLASALHSLQHATAAARLVGATSGLGSNWSFLIDRIPDALPLGESPAGKRIMKCWAPGGPPHKDHCNGIGVVMLRYPLNLSASILSDALHAANLDFYSTQWPDGNAMCVRHKS